MKDPRTFQIIEEEYRSGKKILFAYGFIVYKDIFGARHQTRFGLRYRADTQFNHTYDGFFIDGPKAYNKYT